MSTVFNIKNLAYLRDFSNNSTILTTLWLPLNFSDCQYSVISSYWALIGDRQQIATFLDDCLQTRIKSQHNQPLVMHTLHVLYYILFVFTLNGSGQRIISTTYGKLEGKTVNVDQHMFKVIFFVNFHHILKFFRMSHSRNLLSENCVSASLNGQILGKISGTQLNTVHHVLVILRWEQIQISFLWAKIVCIWMCLPMNIVW